MRLAISPNLPQDDVTSNVLTQTLEPGYVLKQPPLYEWMLWSVQRVTGPTLPSFLFLKYGLLTATFAFLYLVAKRIFTDQRWPAIAALSPLLLYHIGWNLHEGVTQTMALICAVAASMWSFMRLAERGRSVDYVVFGAIVGLGLLSKYSFAGFLVALACRRAVAAYVARAPARLAPAAERRRGRCGHRAVRRLAHCGPARSRRAVWVGHGAACRDEPPQGDADRSRLGDLCAAGFSVSARSDRARAVSGRPARGMDRDQTCREPTNVRTRRAGLASAAPAHHHRRLHRLDLWRAVDRRHALSRAVHAIPSSCSRRCG